MRKWIDLFEASSLTRLYHFTPAKFISSIQTGGLDPRFRLSHSHVREGGHQVYLAGSAAQACEYIHYHEVASGFLLTVEASALDQTKLGPDDVDLAHMVGDGWQSHDWVESIALCGQCAYNGVIPPEEITVAAYVTHDGRRQPINQKLIELSDEWVA